MQTIGVTSRDLPESRANLTLLDRVIVADYTSTIWRGSVADDTIGTMFFLKGMHKDRCDVRGLSVERMVGDWEVAPFRNPLFRLPVIGRVTLQMVKGMTMLYAEAAPGEKSLIIAEYKKALTLYLGSVLSRDKRPPK